MLERRELFYGGMVQGVGFRYTTAHIARRYQVKGFVRNLADGRVELVVEGAAEELERFLEEVAGSFEGMIRDVQTRRSASTDEFDGFRIRY